MSIKLEIRIAESSGLPFTCVPPYVTWELVEYLAARRTPVLYGYCPEGFTVTFQRLDRAAAQALLDDWAQPRASTLNSPQPAPAYDDDLCYLPG